MEILDEKTVVIMNFDELKTVLEEDNNYNYIYFGNNISITSAILINENKSKITIDGTYLDTRYTYTEIGTGDQETITARSTNKNIIIKNMDIVSSQLYGVIYVPFDKEYKPTIEYNNIKYNGVEMIYNPCGKTRIIDCNIIIEDTNNIACEEVCESNNIEIGGITTIISNSLNNSIFNFLNSAMAPSMIFLENSRVTITSINREIMRGTYNLRFEVLHDAVVNLITANGFGANTVFGARHVLIDERATFNFIENKHHRIPMWSIYGNLTINEGANFSVINTYTSTPSDNYNIHFKGSKQNVTINNPNSIVMYTKNANVLYTNNSVDFTLNISRLNLWKNATEFAQAGTINNLPEFAWYKDEGLMTFEGTFDKTTTTINSHNLTDEEIAKLSDLSNLVIQNNKQLSIGTIPINVCPINSNSINISGYTTIDTQVLIKYDSNEIIVDTDESGFFEHVLNDTIIDGTTVEIISCESGNFIYKNREIVTPYNGELTLFEISDNVSFLLEPISFDPVILPKKEKITVEVVDSRLTSSDWKLYLSVINPMISKNNFELKNALVYKDFDDTITILNETPLLVHTGNDTGGSPEKIGVTWSTEKGILLSLENKALEINEEYSSKFIWNVEE